MEPDSTTSDNTGTKTTPNERSFPFVICPSNWRLYKELTNNSGEKSDEIQIVERLQVLGLIPSNVECPNKKPGCQVVCKTARVVDRVQWVCESCGKRQPIRLGSIFMRLQCSILQALQIVLAWCEDADMEVAANCFGVKLKIAAMLYDRLDEIAVKQQSTFKLGGANCVVVVDMYPDCLNRQSPDTTDQPHVHKILMLADTKRYPTNYIFHVIKEDLRNGNNGGASLDNQTIKSRIEEAISSVVVEGSKLVTGATVPPLEGATPVSRIAQRCDPRMLQFLSNRIWRQAISLCNASRDLCVPSGPSAPASGGLACAGFVQRYLSSALYRLRHDYGFYEHTLRVIAREYRYSDNTVS